MARILIIDDDEQIRSLLRSILEDDGYEVAEAADGAEGVRSFRDAPGDLVITNIFMPEKDGLETIRELRREAPDLPIIAVSGGSPRLRVNSTLRPNVLDAARALGAVRTFGKPFDRRELSEAVRSLVARDAINTV